MIYVYAFCPNPVQPLVIPEGITHPTVQLVSVDGLGAIAEFDLDVSQFKDDDEQLITAVLTHDRVLSQLFGQTALLPLRFGTQFTDEASLKTFLQTHQTTYLQRLTLLADRAEYLIKLSPKPIENVPPGSPLKGRAYFLAKKERLQAQAQAQTQQEEELQQFLSGLRTTGIEFIQSDPQEEEKRLHVLSGRNPAIAQAQITHWQQQLPSWQIDCSEPLPPYHFAG